MLDPGVAVRSDGFAAPPGAPPGYARAVAEQALVFSSRARNAHTGLVNGAPAILVIAHGRLATVMTSTIRNGKIAMMEVIADPRRLAQLTIEST